MNIRTIARRGILAFALLFVLVPMSVQAQEAGGVTEAQVQKAIEEVDNLAAQEIADNAVAGLAIAVVFQDKVVFAKGYGVRDTTTSEPIDPDTVFQLASVSAPTGVPEGLAQSFMDTALYGKPRLDWIAFYKRVFSDPAAVGIEPVFDYSNPPASPNPPLGNDAYIGTYTNDYFGDISIAEQDGALVIVEGPNKMTFPLTHYDRDTFTYETVGENAVGTAGITFTIGPDGKASQVVVENLDVRGEGTFQRTHQSDTVRR